MFFWGRRDFFYLKCVVKIPIVFYGVSSYEVTSMLKKNKESGNFIEQGRIHGCPSRVRVGGSSDREGHWGIRAGAASSELKTQKNADRSTDRPIDGQSGV